MKNRFIFLLATALMLTISMANANTSDDVETGVYVTCNIYGASVYIDGTYKGTTPLAITDISTGRHRLEVSKAHYSTDISYIYIDEGKMREARCYLEKISGYLTVNTSPSGATVYCDGDLTGSSDVELDEGNHTVSVKKFGYQEKSEVVYIRRNTKYTTSIQMEPAEFDITGMDSGKTVFNPKNHGDLGNIDLDISVTAPGTGILEITDREGEVVYTKDVEFTTWNQQVQWIGTDPEDYIVEDGVYTATLKAEGKVATYSFMVDSSIVYPMLISTPSGLGIGSVASAQLYPKSTLLLSAESGANFKAVDGDIFYGVPLSLSLSWTPSKHLEFTGTFNGTIKQELTFGFNFAMKVASEYSFGKEKLLYGFFARLGGNSAPEFSPYGADMGNGLGAGILVGYLTNDFYLGLETTYLYKPVMGPFTSSGSDSLWKNGFMIQKLFDSGSMGIFGAITTGYGTFKNEAGTLSQSIESGIRSADFGARFSFYIFDSSATFGVQGGTIIYPSDGFTTMFTGSSTFYPYVKASITWIP